jgi:hypothetical protein
MNEYITHHVQLPSANVTVPLNHMPSHGQSRANFPIPGFGIGVLRDPGAQCTYRDSNPGPTFSIPGFGIETFLAGIPPGLRHDRDSRPL